MPRSVPGPSFGLSPVSPPDGEAFAAWQGHVDAGRIGAGRIGAGRIDPTEEARVLAWEAVVLGRPARKVSRR